MRVVFLLIITLLSLMTIGCMKELVLRRHAIVAASEFSHLPVPVALDGRNTFQLIDTDKDGLPDEEEYLVGRQTSSMTWDIFALLDHDKDGLPNWQDSDSDGDGLLDGNDPYPTDPFSDLGPTFAVKWNSSTDAPEQMQIFSNTAEMFANAETRVFSNAQVGLMAQIEKLANDEWELTVSNVGPNTIRQVIFPFQTHKYQLNATTEDDRLYYPFRMGKVSRMKTASGQWIGDFSYNDNSLVYPGSAFSPLTVLADETRARVVASLMFPPIPVSPSWDLKRQYLHFRKPIAPSENQKYRILVKEVSGHSKDGSEPWQIALDAYKSRLKQWMFQEALDPTALPSWMKSSHGWLAAGVMNYRDFRTHTLEDNWNRWKDKFPWMQVWGQMSNYPGVNPFPAASLFEVFGCCTGITDLHLRYTDPDLLGGKKSLLEIAAIVTADQGHIGYYSRPRTACDPAITTPYTQENCQNGDPDGDGAFQNDLYPLDDPTPLPQVGLSNLDYLVGWMSKQKNQWGANAYYVDVLGCLPWAEDPLFVPNLYNAHADLFSNSVHECHQDYYSGMGLMSGALGLFRNRVGGEGESLSTQTTVSDPFFGRYLMDEHAILLGHSNGDHVYYGNANEYWGERQAFLLGARFDVPPSGLLESPENPNSPMNSLIRQALESREAFSWWSQDLKFRATRGLANIPKQIRVTRFEKDHATFLAMDNFQAGSSSVTLTVDGITGTYAIPWDVLTQRPKSLVLCPLTQPAGCR